MTEAIRFRLAEEKDAALVYHFIRALAEYEHLSDQVAVTEADIREHVFQKQRAQALIGEVEGKAVGFALFFFNYSTFVGRPGLYVEDLFVYPEYRGRGYGKAFFQEMAKIAQEKKCGRMEWSCLDWNQPSIAFYRSLGAVPMEEWTVFRLTEDAFGRLAEENASQA